MQPLQVLPFKQITKTKHATFKFFSKDYTLLISSAMSNLEPVVSIEVTVLAFHCVSHIGVAVLCVAHNNFFIFGG